MATGELTLRRAVARRMSDEDALNCAIQGDPVAFAEFYRRYRHLTYGYCLARLRNAEAAADATQEVFLRVLRTHSADDVRNARAWLFRVSANVVVDVTRSARQDVLVAQPEDCCPAGPALTSPDSADQAISREDARLIFLGLRRLSPRYRTALILREFHGMSSAEMGQALDLKPGAVDTLVSRARDAFGRVYAESADFPFECRESIEAIYQDLGSGLTPARRARLEAHLQGCPRCREERRRATDPRRLRMLWPLIAPASRFVRGPFARALGIAGASPDVLWASAPRFAESLAAVALVAALVVAPLAPRSTSAVGDTNDRTAAAMASVDAAPQTAHVRTQDRTQVSTTLSEGTQEHDIVPGRRSGVGAQPNGGYAGPPLGAEEPRRDAGGAWSAGPDSAGPRSAPSSVGRGEPALTPGQDTGGSQESISSGSGESGGATDPGSTASGGAQTQTTAGFGLPEGGVAPAGPDSPGGTESAAGGQEPPSAGDDRSAATSGSFGGTTGGRP